MELHDKDGNIIGWHIEPDPETREATQKWLIENMTPNHDWHVMQWAQRFFVPPTPNRWRGELLPPVLGTDPPGYVPKGELFEVAVSWPVYHDKHVRVWELVMRRKFIDSIPPIDVRGVLGIPPKVEYGREKDTRIRDDRFGDQAGD
jgi:hypothetical protein